MSKSAPPVDHNRTTHRRRGRLALYILCVAIGRLAECCLGFDREDRLTLRTFYPVLSGNEFVVVLVPRLFTFAKMLSCELKLGSQGGTLGRVAVKLAGSLFETDVPLSDSRNAHPFCGTWNDARFPSLQTWLPMPLWLWRPLQTRISALARYLLQAVSQYQTILSHLC